MGYQLSASGQRIEGGWIGVGSNELSMNLPPGMSMLVVCVKVPGGAQGEPADQSVALRHSAAGP